MGLRPKGSSLCRLAVLVSLVSVAHTVASDRLPPASAQPDSRLDSPETASSTNHTSSRADPCDSCDMNCDSFYDVLDIPIFVGILVQGSSGCSPCTGDLDGNGHYDGRDIQLFVACLLPTLNGQVVIVANGTVVPNPTYPYQMESYNEGDLPELRAFASAAGVFSDVDMNLDWKEREWEMIKAIRTWVVRHARWSKKGLDSKEDLSGRAIAFLNAISAGGSIVAWGDDDLYGNVSGVSDLNPNNGFVAIAAGAQHSIALRRNGEIEAWGRNHLGQGSEPSSNSDFISLAAGANHNLGLKSDGSVVAWGDNSFGQCNVPLSNANFVAVAAGMEFSMGLKSDGTVVVWGVLPNDVPLNNAWQGRFIKIAAGGYHCVGLLDDGTPVAWGSNSNGQCVVPTHAGGIPLQNHILTIAADKRRSYATIDFGFGFVSWGLPLDPNFLAGGGYQYIWPNPTQKYLLVSKDAIPVVQAIIDKPTLAPPKSVFTSVAFDSDRKVVTKFGGESFDFSTQQNDTLEWEGREWDSKSPTLLPDARSEHVFAYDSSRHVSVLWGGTSVVGERDAWEWNGENWAGPYATGGTRPSAAFGCATAFDPNRGSGTPGRLVLFGGYDAGGTRFQTAFDYNASTHSWENHSLAAPSPSARSWSTLAYDSGRNKLILFGGFNGSVAINDTWEAAAGGTGNTVFTQITPATTSPSIRYQHAMVHDSARGVTVLFGGRNGSVYNNETWEWNGTDWTPITTANAPSARAGHGMTYDSEREVVVLYGGYSPVAGVGVNQETWEYDGTDWTQRNLTIIPSGTIPDLSDTDFVYAGYATGDQFGLGLVDYVWSCGAIQQMFAGLCVAHGIPARRISGMSQACAGDVIVEVFSTRWNKWILFWPIAGRWVENAAGIPLSHADMRAHYAAANYSLGPSYDRAIGRRGWKATATNGSGLVFQPNAVCTAPLHPQVALKWWSDTLIVNPIFPDDDDHDHFERNATTSLSKYNQPDPQSSTVLWNDFFVIDAHCETHFYGSPITYDDDPNLTYPINNVHAEAVLMQDDPFKVRITLTHNMVVGTGGFEHYEMSLNDGLSWTMLALEAEGPGVYNWYPTDSTTLMIRGVNVAGVHSPDVVISFSAGTRGRQGDAR
jgi:Regulator of Chromosome Condensation (RCC1) repeat protein/galactose oxidase-like protein